MPIRRSLILAAALAASATQSLAGGFAPAVAVPEPVVVVEPEAPRSTWGILLPLLLLGALVLIATRDDDEEEEDEDDCQNGTTASAVAIAVPVDPCDA